MAARRLRTGGWFASSVLVALALLFACASFAYADDSAAEPEAVAVAEPQPVEVASPAPANNDALFEEYLQVQMAPSDDSGNSKARRAKLSAVNKAVYDSLKKQIAAVAAGESASTQFTVPLEDVPSLANASWTAADLGLDSLLQDGAISDATVDAVMAEAGIDASRVLKALLGDCPYELYWYDKTAGVEAYGFSISVEGYGDDLTARLSGEMAFAFSVAEGYSAGDYRVDTSKMERVRTAVANAQAIVDSYRDATDRTKLAGYCDAICDAVTYDNAAASDHNTPYGDSWQIISVFDGDAGTNVVCEGYTKAFQYLCDLSEFSGGTRCITVSGTMWGGTGAGAHMWNIVTMDDGKNYLVDVTNCDAGAVGAPDLLFLAGTSDGGPDDWYSFDCSGDVAAYHYNGEMLDTFSEAELTLASSAYVEGSQGSGSGGQGGQEGQQDQEGQQGSGGQEGSGDQEGSGGQEGSGDQEGSGGQEGSGDQEGSGGQEGQGSQGGQQGEQDQEGQGNQEGQDDQQSQGGSDNQEGSGNQGGQQGQQGSGDQDDQQSQGNQETGAGEAGGGDANDNPTSDNPTSDNPAGDDPVNGDAENGNTTVIDKVPGGSSADDASGGNSGGSNPGGNSAGNNSDGNSGGVVPAPVLPTKVTGTVSTTNPVAAAAIGKLLTSAKSDADPKGATFGQLQAKGTAKSSASVKLKWKKVPGATGYVVYGAKCGKGNKLQKLKSLKKTAFTQKKLKKAAYYKYVVVAVKGDAAIAVSTVVHVATKGGKVGNAKSVSVAAKAKKGKLTLKKGKSFKLSAKAVAQSAKLKMKTHRKVAYESSNPSVATVNKKGVVKARAKGACVVYAYAQNGVAKAVKVVVK